MPARSLIRWLALPALVILIAVLLSGRSTTASPGITTLVGYYGEEPAISADGRYVAFSYAEQVFVHDRQTGTTEPVSVDSGGDEGNNYSDWPAISADGRYVTFESQASNLVPGDTNGSQDVFVHDRQTEQTTRVSVDSAGNQGNSASRWPAISADGRYVAFESEASNLVSGDTNNYCGLDGHTNCLDVFVHDRQTGVTERVSVDSAGNEGDSASSGAAISADGRYVAFDSCASNLVPGDTNGKTDIFVHDRQTGETTRVSVDSADNQGNSHSGAPAISSEGRYVAFESQASNLVPGDSNNYCGPEGSTNCSDIFVRDRQTGETTRVSVDSAGNQANDESLWIAISADGRYVTFTSPASNLVPSDTNYTYDIFVHDRQTGITERASVDSAGNQANQWSELPDISGNGRYVAFESYASNLVPGDTNGWWDVFVHDRDDEDGVDWTVDNCPTVPNPDQADFNSDGLGDVCVDSDRDGCLDAEELPSALAPKPGSTGAYDPLAWYDFFDVPVPANADPIPNGNRDGAVTMSDVLAVLRYVFTYEGGPANKNGLDYDSDKNGDTVKDGRDYDRSGGPGPNPPWEAGAPDGAVSMDDVMVLLPQVGLSCIGPP